MSGDQGRSGRDRRGITLRTQLGLTIGPLVLVLLIGNVLLTIHQTRVFLQETLAIHARDAATSLGMMLSKVPEIREDPGLAERLIDATYDSGYFRRIVYSDAEGNPLVVRESSLELEGVPEWLVESVPLETPEGVSEVVDGWHRLGSMVVVSHPGEAYRNLWASVKQQSVLFLVIAVLGYLLLHVALTVLLKPLKRMEIQAKAIGERDFSVRATLPGTRELRRVANAMNDMAAHIQLVFEEQLALIEQLRGQVYRDSVTGFGNREDFDQRMKAQLESRDLVPVGTLMLMQISQFAEFNRNQGRRQGDELLQRVASCLKRSVSSVSHVILGRRAGADFAVYLPGVVDEDAEAVAESCLGALQALPLMKTTGLKEPVHFGLVSVRERRALSELLGEADLALRQAQSEPGRGWIRQVRREEEDSAIRSAGDWQKLLREVIGRRQLLRHYQPVYQVPDKGLAFHLSLARIRDGEELIPAGAFLPMAERFELLADIDRLNLELLVAELSGERVAARIACNLSARSFADAGFVSWLEAFLEKTPGNVLQHLILEFPEHVLGHNLQAAERICKLAKRLGCGLCVDRFGTAGIPFSYLQHLPLDYIKVHPSFIRKLDAHPDNQFFLRTVLQIARGQRVAVIAMGVETDAEWAAIKELGLDAAMGYFLGRPADSLSW